MGPNSFTDDQKFNFNGTKTLVMITHLFWMGEQFHMFEGLL